MGVGKTLQAIAIAYLYKQDWPLLILTPSSLKLQWADEINRWLEIHPRDIVIINSSKEVEYIRSFTCETIFIVSYDLAAKLVE